MEEDYTSGAKAWLWGAVAFIAFILLIASIGTVGAGERGVELRFGAVTGEIYPEGLYFKLPFIERIVTMNVQNQKIQADADAASRDLQSVSTTIALNYRLLPDETAHIYQEVRTDYKQRVIDPAIQEGVKAATARFTAEELITKRPAVREEIKKEIANKLNPVGLEILEFNIVNFSFSESFAESIEKKVTAEQDALTAKNKLQQVKFEADQRIEEAKGKAEAIRVEAQALRNNPQIINIRAIEKWDGVMPRVTGENMPLINIQ